MSLNKPAPQILVWFFWCLLPSVLLQIFSMVLNTIHNPSSLDDIPYTLYIPLTIVIYTIILGFSVTIANYFEKNVIDIELTPDAIDKIKKTNSNNTYILKQSNH